MSAWLDLYEPLDVIGNGSFGIIRKVRRKADGLLFARKELNFERMSERDRKQIVAEVNILKDLHHEHIVRYHDRYVDRDAGILYILMEYCGGGDLSAVIKQAMKHNRPISEDLVWNYFMQILLALHHCHHPNGHGRSGSGSGSAVVGGGDGDTITTGGASRRPQILHRDLKPDNVFLDEANNVKLGDFGLSKALNQASFANTYVGTPYYMSPELMQEKAYDSKSDIWSLGCLVYELCALKPPFHEAKTHSELSGLIRNGRIPPLPRGYSQALFGVIKAMLNLNPAMRPSAAQLLQHERLELVFKVAETEKMLATVKQHKNAMVARERDVLAREHTLSEKEQQLQSLFAQKEAEAASLRRHIQQLQHQIQHAATPPSQPQLSQHEMDGAIKRAVARREEELRVLVMKREEEVAAAMAKREEEIMEAVRRREAEVCEAWTKREEEIRREVEVSIKAVEERIAWISNREGELGEEEDRLEGVRDELEEKERELEAKQRQVEAREAQTRWGECSSAQYAKFTEDDQLLVARGSKSPLEEIRNGTEPTPKKIQHETPALVMKHRRTSSASSATSSSTISPSTVANTTSFNPKQAFHNTSVTLSTKKLDATPRPAKHHAQALPALETPITRPLYTDYLPSAMKGVVLTSTGETLATPSPNELVTLFNSSPKVGLNFGKIFDFGDSQDHTLTRMGPNGGIGGVQFPGGYEDEEDVEEPPSPSTRKEKELREKDERARVGSWGWDEERERASGVASTTGITSVNSNSNANTTSPNVSSQSTAAPPSRIRKPSIRRTASATSAGGPSTSMVGLFAANRRSVNLNGVAGASEASSGSSSGTCSQSSSSSSNTSACTPSSSTSTSNSFQAKPLPHPHLPSTSRTNGASGVLVPSNVVNSGAAPRYDLVDEENLPSPFLKRVDRMVVGASTSSSSAQPARNDGNAVACSARGDANSSRSEGTSTALRITKKRPSTGNLLRTMAAANNSRKSQTAGGACTTQASSMPSVPIDVVDGSSSRASIANPRKGGEEGRRLFLKPS